MSINLDGCEISIIKALGLSGGEVSGKILLTRVGNLGIAELIDSLSGLIETGYVVTDSATFGSKRELEAASFHVNSGYSKDLKEAMDPSPREKPNSRRLRRE